MAHVDQNAVPCAYIRGGTSKALFFHEKDLPPPGELRDDVLKRAMGSPDAHQIDGMGGCSTHTSKVAIIGPPTEVGADINFTFAQISVKGTVISYEGNCGNISSAVGAFAIDEGLLKSHRKGQGANPKITAREVRIYNTNTKKILLSHVPIEESSGFSITSGDTSIPGVPGTGAPILMDYRNVSFPDPRKLILRGLPLIYS
jgi:2-methylaconitate cis-trans-isomerase PrpF